MTNTSNFYPKPLSNSQILPILISYSSSTFSYLFLPPPASKAPKVTFSA